MSEFKSNIIGTSFIYTSEHSLSVLFCFVFLTCRGTGRLMQRSLRLYVYLCETQYLDEVRMISDSVSKRPILS